jgi:hypothetical protein
MKLLNRGIQIALAGATLLTASAVMADYSSAVQSQGPVGYWRLNETVQPQLIDYIARNFGSLGTSYNGTFTDGAKRGGPSAIVSEPTHASAYFPGAVEGGRVRIPYNDAWNTSAFSVEFWAKPAQTGGLVCPAASTTFPSSSTDTSRAGWLFYQGPPSSDSGNGWYFRVYYLNGSTLGSKAAAVALPIDTNAWYHVAGVFDGSILKLYVNGSLAATASLPAGAAFIPSSDGSTPLTFGARADGNLGYWTYPGYIDEAAVYSKVLTDAQILSHYQAGVATAPATAYQQVILTDAPAGYWRFDEVDPATPIAANLGTLGAAANGSYYYPATVGSVGPRPSDFNGFESGNTGVAFDGTGGSVTIPALNMDTDTITITAWIKRNGDQVGDAAIVMTDSAKTIAGLKIDQSEQELSYTWNGNTADSSFRSYLGIPDNTWVFTALVIKPDSALLALQDGSAWTTTINYVAHDSLPFEDVTLIGTNSAKSDLIFKGSIDEVAIFNRALSVGELFTEYASAVGGVAPQLFTDAVVSPDMPYAGDTLTISVDAGGTAPLTYVWKKGSTVISGATNAVYTKSGITTADSGNYTVVISNPFGTVSKEDIAVTVSASEVPTISLDPVGRTLYPGGYLHLITSAAGGNLSYQWKLNGTAITGATNSSYTVSSVTAADSGSYTVTVKNSLGTATSGAAAITVVTPATGSYEAAIVADVPFGWWRLNEPAGESTAYDSMGRNDGAYQVSAVLGAKGVVANSTDTAVTSDGSSPIALVPYTKDLNRESFTLEVWAKTAIAGTQMSPVSTYSLTSEGGRGIGFLKTDADQWLGISGNADKYYYYYGDMQFLTLNRWTHLAVTYDDASSALRYYQNGVLVAGPYAGGYKKNVTDPFVIGGLNPGGNMESFWNGQIDEVVYYGAVLNDAQIQAHYTAALYAAGSKPVFTVQPLSRTAIEGSSVTLSVTVEGTLPIGVQWNFNGTAIANATNTSYTISPVDYVNAGTYTVTAVNSVGTTVSSAAVLKVVPEPVFANVTNGLVLHLKFDGDLSDASGRGNAGTAVGDISYVSDGKVGKALHYSTDSDNDSYNYVDLGTPSDLAFGSGNFSVGFWIRLPSGSLPGDLPFFANSEGSYSNPGLTIAPSYNRGGWSWGIGSLGIYGDDKSINNGNWHHLLYCFDRSSVAVTYLDGVAVDTRPDLAGGSINTGNNFSIGQDATGTYSENGEADIDDFGVWNRALTDDEVYDIYSAATTYGKSFDVVGPVTIQVRQAASAVEVIWQAGTLQEAPSITGPWTSVSGATAPYYKTSTTTGTKFYRVKL